MSKNQVGMKNGEGRYSMKGSSLWGILLFAVLVFIDMTTKIVADACLNPSDEPIAIIPGYLEIFMRYNRGVAFSMADNWQAPAKIALVLSTCVLFVLFAVYYFKVDKRRSWLRFALVLIVAGGVGNLIDRVYYQVWEPYVYGDPTTWDGVRDMVYVKIWIFDFGVCNFADFFIVGGAIVLIAAMLFFDTEAMFPLTKKYKALAREAESESERKKEQKVAKKKAALEAKKQKKE